MATKKLTHLHVENLGPVAAADMRLGDLTVVVGPQATGKSVLLQTLKLGLDTPAIRSTLLRNGFEWPRPHGWHSFLEQFYGEGMGGIWNDDDTVVELDNSSIGANLLARRSYKENVEPCVLYVPAQRALTIPDGFPRAFRDCDSAMPYSVREFSDHLNKMATRKGEAHFPRPGKLDAPLRKRIDEAIFRGGSLSVEQSGRRRSELLLSVGDERLPVISWTAGQREFVPLMLGLYPALPGGAIAKAPGLDWILIEEPEMGLHPRAIVSTMYLVLELIWRGYRVVLSTHHPVVVDVIWAINTLRQAGPKGPKLLLKAFEAPSNPKTKMLAQRALEADIHVYALQYKSGPGGATSTDISSLDPAATDDLERGWGGLTHYSGVFAEAVAEAVASR